ncbi:Spy/CpxP family protein refolding chaperone [Gilvibacter sp. SZ-19]|jgi:Spy/CpxP family protein refolding chaperone|uniref:Spy/CpxP family protein refolding chaperone n=1 Tax=unclassified Gilvibacter TaxID=2625242 RepID=UPI000B3C859D|nr:Spy/CpxP family protein refolding chaperone [Gilvibacter sp. SZ-19]ARV10965.1 hypothetical protein BTO09_00800 [Gilvibacter sp. SZ-19]
MKKFYYILLLSFMLIGFSADAQRQRPNPGEIEAQKTAFITNNLDLTPEQAQKFWPIYNASEKRMESIRRQQREALMKVRLNGGAVSDSEAWDLIENLMSWEQSMLDERKNLVAQLKGVVTPQQILKLKRAEEEFKRRLLQAMQRRRKN